MAKRARWYRAKRVDGRGWAYGIPVKNLMIYNTYLTFDKDTSKQVTNFAYFEIALETLCEFAGINDKNGKKIFEGDILKYIGEGGTPEYFVVSWSENPMRYIISETKTGCEDILDDFVHQNMEVAGNIYDNPELIGGEQK